jgi:hypothetical protein
MPKTKTVKTRKPKKTDSKKDDHSRKDSHNVVVNVGTDTTRRTTRKKGTQSFTKGNAYLGGTPMRGVAYPSPTVINNMQPPTMMPPMIFHQMDANRLNAIENSINNIGTDVQALHGRLNKPSHDEVKSYIPSSIDSMRTQLASAAESRMETPAFTQHMHNQLTHDIPHADPMSVDTTQPVPMSINTSQQSSSMSTAQFGGSDDSSGGGGGGGGYPPNSPSVQTASTPVRSIDMVRLDRENSNASAGSRVSNPDIEMIGEKLRKVKTKKEESPKAESDYSFDTPKPSMYDVTPVVGQSYEDMEQSFSGKRRTANLTDSDTFEIYSPSELELLKQKIARLVKSQNKLQDKKTVKGELENDDKYKFDNNSRKLKKYFGRAFPYRSPPKNITKTVLKDFEEFIAS